MVIKCYIYLFPTTKGEVDKLNPESKKTSKKKVPKLARIVFQKEMLKRMLEYIEKHGESEGTITFTAVARKATDEFLKKYGL